MMPHQRLIVAIDGENLTEVGYLFWQLREHVQNIKIGSTLFTAHGPEIIRQATGGASDLDQQEYNIFLDLKYIDIPDIVAQSVVNAVLLKVKMISVYSRGGEAMMKACVCALDEVMAGKYSASHRPLLIAVPTLTSIEHHDDNGIGNQAAQAINAGFDGVTCSPRGIQSIRGFIGEKPLIIVPGIRPVESKEMGSHRKVDTPCEAIRQGADYIVVGRPITQSDNPGKMTEEIIGEINIGLEMRKING